MARPTRTLALGDRAAASQYLRGIRAMPSQKKAPSGGQLYWSSSLRVWLDVHADSFGYWAALYSTCPC